MVPTLEPRQNAQQLHPGCIPCVGALIVQQWPKWRIWVIASIAIVLGALLVNALRTLGSEIHYVDVVAQIDRTPWRNVLLAAVATAVSYLVLTGYDFSALEYAGVRVQRSTVLLTSFIAYALGNTVGLGVLTGGAVRMRLYSAAGIDVERLVPAVAFNASAFAIGIAAFGAGGMLWGASEVASLLVIPVWVLRSLAAVVLLLIAALVVTAAQHRELRIARWQVRLPPAALMLRQLLISALDLSASAAALWLLLPSGVIEFPGFLAWYAIAVALGLVSHIPGGLGVFEAVILLACTGRARPDEIIAALVLYRVIYYLLPLLLAAVLLAVYELRSGVAAPIARAAIKLSPALLATLTFIAGTWLLVSGATPASGEATDLLELHVPLPLVEASHFIGSIAGVALLIVARGLLHRLDAAWWTAFLLALIASVLALPKGIALSEGAYLSTLALLLLTSRRQFHRRSMLFGQTLTTSWLVSIVGVIAACLVLLLFVYRQVDFTHELWWQFEFDAHAPRSLRAMTGVAIATLGLALWRLFHSAPQIPTRPSTADLDKARAIIGAQSFADANLALTGDKHLMFSASGDAFIMFGRQARSWIALFDPVGPVAEWAELIWRFIEHATDQGGRVACYQVRPTALPLYLDAGLRAYKLGEYAYVLLEQFSMKGSKRSNIRQSVNRAQREGMSFALLSPQEARMLITDLKSISDAWLAAARSREKGFSLGAFDERYLFRYPIAIVRQHERIVAFANVLSTELKHEVTVDLMRHVPDAPHGAMDFMFAELMLHYKAEGYERFGLGMAPLSGMAQHALAPRWHRFGQFLFDYGESFYNFRGLRAFKEKFLPVWEARYLAAPGGVSALAVLADAALLINRGPRSRAVE